MKYFSYLPETGFEIHDTKGEAIKACEKELADCLDSSEGWPEEAEEVCWGEIKGIATKCDERKGEFGEEFENYWNYKIKPVQEPTPTTKES